MSRSLPQLKKRIKQFQSAYGDEDLKRFLNEGNGFFSNETYADIQAALNTILTTDLSSVDKRSENQLNESYDVLINALAESQCKYELAPGFTITPLSLAVDNRFDLLAHDLLEKNADPNTSYNGCTPLHDAVSQSISDNERHNLNIIKILLNHPTTDRARTNKEGRTASEEAQHRNNDLVVALFDSGANLALPESWDIDAPEIRREKHDEPRSYKVIRRPQREKNIITRMIDYSNRQGLEAFVDFFVNWKSTWAYYRNKQINGSQVELVPLYKAIPRALFGFCIRAALLFITASVYVISRLGFLLGLGSRSKEGMTPTRNPFKSEYMGVAVMTMTGMVFELSIELITPEALQTLAHAFGMAGSGTGAYVVGAVLMTAMVMISTSFFLYGGKLKAKNDNAMVLAPPASSADQTIVNITTPKHYPISDPAVPDEFRTLQRTILYAHQLKKRPVIYGTTPEQEAVKCVLTEFENVGKANAKGILEQYHLDCLITAAVDQQGIVGEAFASDLQTFAVENKKLVKLRS